MQATDRWLMEMRIILPLILTLSIVTPAIAQDDDDDCATYGHEKQIVWGVYARCAAAYGIAATAIAIACPVAAEAVQVAGCEKVLQCYHTYINEVAALNKKYPDCAQ
jgi:hypothetical protein